MTILDEYNRARKNLNARINRLRKMGFDIPQEIIPKPVKKPTQKSIKRLQSFTSDEIKKRSGYKTKTTAKPTAKPSTKTPKKKTTTTTKKKTKKAPKYTSFGSLAIQRTRDTIQTGKNLPHFGKGAEEIETVIDNLVAKYGEDIVGSAMIKIEGEGVSLDLNTFYDPNSSLRQQYISHLISAIDEAGDYTRDEINDLLNVIGAGYSVEE